MYLSRSVSSEDSTDASSSGTELKLLKRSPSNLNREPQEGDLKALIKNILKKSSQIKATPEEDRLIRIYDTMILFLAFLGIAIMMVQLLVFWEYTPGQDGMYTNQTVQNLKMANIAVTGALYIFMIFHTRLSYKLIRREWKGFPKALKAKLSVIFYIKATIRFAICAIQPIPYVNIDKIGVFMFLRLWAVVPVLRDYHPIFTHRREISKSHRFALPSNTRTFSSTTCVKAVFFTDPLLAVSITVLFSFCIASFCVYILERDHHSPEEDPNINYVYMALITITTVGYGDYSPNSPFGRAACVITGFVGIITTAFFINMISSHLQLSPLQKEASDWTVQRHNYLTLQNHAASFIQINWRHYVHMKKTKFNTVDAKIHAKAVHRGRAVKSLKKLRNLRRKMMVSDYHAEDPVLDKILSMEKTISSLESQNKMLLTKLDTLTDLIIRSPSISTPLSFSTPSLPPSRLPSVANNISFGKNGASSECQE